MTYSRAVRTTMGPGCLTAVFGMGTGVAIQVSSPESHALYQKGSGRSQSLHCLAGGRGASPWPAEKRINAVKRSAVSTGPLRALLLVHFRPIDLVVFQEPA